MANKEAMDSHKMKYPNVIFKQRLLKGDKNRDIEPKELRVQVIVE